jgi:hypothetical protein
MTPEGVVKEVQENAAEWLEMSENPAAVVAGILAHKVVALSEHVEYLEKRLEHATM